MKQLPTILAIIALVLAGGGFYFNFQSLKQLELKTLAVEKSLSELLMRHEGKPITDIANQQSTLTVPTPPPNLPVTSISFEKLEHNFGTIVQGEKVKTKFKFTNTGNSNLLISNASGSCGCTVPEYPKEPIAPGKSGEILVEFDSGGKEGEQSKTVTVEANTEPRQTVLTIKSNIIVNK